MKIARTEIFKKDFQKLPDRIRKVAAKQIAQLLMDHTRPSLRLEGITGHGGIFSIRVDRRYRISISFIEKDTVLLRRVLDHDDLYRNP